MSGVVAAERAESLDVRAARFAAGRGGDVVEGAPGGDRVVDGRLNNNATARAAPSRASARSVRGLGVHVLSIGILSASGWPRGVCVGRRPGRFCGVVRQFARCRSGGSRDIG